MAITIALSGKGGSGKTTLAAMIIRVLADRSSKPVLAVDADVGAVGDGDVGVAALLQQLNQGCQHPQVGGVASEGSEVVV